MNAFRSMVGYCALLVCLVSTVRAASEWNLATGGEWNVAGNWSTDSVPDSPTVTANMHDRLTTVTFAGNVIDLEGMNRAVKQLDFQTTNLGVFYNIADGTLTLGDAANAGAITVGAANSNDQTISAGLNYANAATTITNASNNVLNLTGAQNWDGHQVTVTAGTVNFEASAPGANTSGASLEINSGAIVDLSGAQTATSDGTNDVQINNAGALLVGGVSQRVGSVTGGGKIAVGAGGGLTANRIIQSALLISGTATNHGSMSIAASDSSGNPLSASLGLRASQTASGLFAAGVSSTSLLADLASVDSSATAFALSNDSAAFGGQAVPEPESWLLVGIGAIALGEMSIASRRKTRPESRSSPARIERILNRSDSAPSI